MAVAATNLTSGADITAGTTAVTASITLPALELGLLTINSRTGITADPNQPTATGWTVINSIVYDTSSSSRRRVTVLRRLDASPTTGTITLDFGGQTQTNIQWCVDDLTGIITTGTNGADAIIQSVTAKDETVASNTFSITLAAFGNVNNATFGGMASIGDDVFTAGSGFAFLGKIDTVSDINTASEFRSTNDTTVDISSNVATGWGGVAIEIAAGAAPAANGDFFKLF